ncbi:MAG: sigma 54-interacting transcriptional regulator [Phycisphaerae bacterium]|nr:sigma 54-interacting transcriptional regulator [Phycisphaerae bacterium]
MNAPNLTGEASRISGDDALSTGPISVSASGDTYEQLMTQFVTASSALGAVRDIATSIAARRSTVMLLGETGTGKEMLARHIHYTSDRATMPFVPVDCSAMTETLFESQMFGHVRGAFTGAIRDSLGFIRAADRGTLFLDEVGELNVSLQAKLLRVIQERSVIPVGDTRPRPVDVRIVRATHRDLSSMVRTGAFRQDLFFRLNVVVMNVPPLRERPDDIVPLAAHFLRMQAALYDEQPKTISAEAVAALRAYSWPGNVRELSNVIEHAHVIASSSEIRLSDLPSAFRKPGVLPAIVSDLCLIDVERRTISEALHRTNFNKAGAARLLGLNIQRLNRRIRSLGITIPSST